MEKEMSWLIKTDKDNFEVWSDREYSMMKQKCEYYGAKPHWVEIRQLDTKTATNELNWSPSRSWDKKKSLVLQ